MPSQLDTFSTAGAFTYTIPTWAYKVDIILLGGGAAGTNGTLGNGSGGKAGSWITVTVTRGLDIPFGTSSITGTVGTGGTGNGGNGVASTAAATGMTSRSAAGGSGNMGLVDPNGQGAGTQVYNGQTYVGGAIRNVALGSAGNPPGGGGQGGGVFGSGGAGAIGRVWFYAYGAFADVAQTITASTSAGFGRLIPLTADLSAVVTASAAGVKSSFASASLAANASTSTSLGYSLSSALSVTASLTGMGYEYGVTSSSTTVTASAAADAVKTQYISGGSLTATVSASGGMKNAAVGSALLPSVVVSTSAGFVNAGVSSSALTVTASSAGEAVENDLANSTGTISVSRASELGRLAPISGAATVATASASADVIKTQYASSALSAVASVAAAAVNPAPLSSLSDYFNGSTINTAVWNVYRGQVVSNGQLSMVPLISSGSYPIIQAVGYSFKEGQSLSFQIIQPPNVGNGTITTSFSIADRSGTGSSIQILHNNNTLVMRTSTSAGVYNYFALAYTADLSWIRVTRSSGNVIFDTAPDGITWTTRLSLSNSADPNWRLEYASFGVACYFTGTEPAPGTLIIDNFNVLPLQAAAALTATSSTSSSGSRGQSITSNLSAVSSQDFTIRYEAKAQAPTTALVTVDSVAMKTLNATASLTATATAAGSGIESDTGTVQATVTASPSAGMIRGQSMAVTLNDVTATANSGISRGQSIISNGQDLGIASGTGNARYDARGNVILTAYATSSADSKKTQYITASLTVTASASGAGIETDYGIASLTATVSTSAGMVSRQSITSAASILTSRFSTVNKISTASAAYQISVLTDVDIEEPRETAIVPFDDRNVSVPDYDNAAVVLPDLRSVSVASSRAVVIVVADVRSVAVVFDLRAVSVSTQGRTAIVPSEEFLATV